MPDTIILQTAKASSIENSRAGELTRWDIASFGDFEREYGSSTTERAPATPVYNCHGLTFASRRTGVHTDLAVSTIIDDDSYKEVPVDEVLPGDAALYYGDEGNVIHSAIVVEGPTQQAYGVPMVISKWGKYKELIHRAKQCPYAMGYVKYYRTHGT